MGAPERRPPASPCIGTCVMDRQAGLCTGCARSLDEIVRWGAADAAERARVWAELPARAARLRLGLRRLEWRGAALLDAVATRLVSGWSLRAGPPGATLEVAGPGQAAIGPDGALVLSTACAALRLEAPHWLAAFEITPTDASPHLVLAVPPGRAGTAVTARTEGRHIVEAPCLIAEADAPPVPFGSAPPLPKGWLPVAVLHPG